MSAYYNEIDPQAAQWLRNLIKAGLIAPGDVDCRSIAEVQPDDLKGYTQCHFFAGIGVWSYALRRAGWRDDRPVWTGSCPCQPFSAAGKRAGFDDERHLWPEWFRLISKCRPLVVFGEQVASKIALAWIDHVSVDLEAAAYAFGAVDTCAAGFGAPHIRQRLYFVADSVHAGRSQRRSVPRDGPLTRCGSARALAHADEGRSRGDTGAIHGAQGTPEREVRCVTDRVEPRSAVSDVGVAHGDADRERFEGVGLRVLARGSQQGGPEVDRSGDVSGVGMADAAGERYERLGGTWGWRVGPSDDCAVSGVAQGDADEPGSQGRRVQPRDSASECAVGQAGPVNGFWERCDWIPCTDGKARPVEPGTFPLVTGAPARVVRLRAYGNSINTEQAKEFIKAYDSL